MKEFKSSVPLYTLKESGVVYKKIKITKSGDSYGQAMQYYGDDINIYESMFVMFLNHSNNTIGHVKISQGGISGTSVDVKIIAKYAIDMMASGIIMVHNHPSGGLVPSDSDRLITEKVKNGLDLLDIVLLDHLIVTSESYYSFSDNSIL